MTSAGGDERGRSNAASLLVFPGYIAAALLLTWPLVRDIGHVLPTVVGLPDALLQAFILNWDLRTLASHPFGVFDIPIFHPEKNVLTYMDHLLGESIVATPAMMLTHNTAVAYNSVVLFSYVASAWAMYRLVRVIGVSRGGSFIAGLLFAFSPYRYCNMANLNLLQTEFLPLGLFFAVRAAKSGRPRDLIATGATLAAQSYFSWYYTFYLGIALVVFAVHQMIAGRLRVRQLVSGRALAPLAVTVVLLLPGLVPYLSQRGAMRGYERSLGMTSLWSADLLDYLKINVENRAFAAVPALSGDQPYFPGLVAVVLAVFGVIALLRREGAARLVRRLGDGGYFIALGAIGFVLSLGPVLRVAGHRLWVPLPYLIVFYVVPGFASMRASGRLAVLVLLATCVLAGLGYESYRARVPTRRSDALLFYRILVAAIVFAWSVPWPMVHFPSHDEIPPVYRWLEHQPGDFAVLDLPVPVREQDEGQREVTYQIYAIYHRKPLVDGVSGFVSPAHRAFRTVLQGFPSREAIAAAAARGTGVVIVHYGDLAPEARTRVRDAAAQEPALMKVAEFGDDVAYEVSSGRK